MTKKELAAIKKSVEAINERIAPPCAISIVYAAGEHGVHDNAMEVYFHLIEAFLLVALANGAPRDPKYWHIIPNMIGLGVDARQRGVPEPDDADLLAPA